MLIFSEKKSDVDDIHEYLLLKGVNTVALHGSKDQEERDMAIRAFREGRADVLVATDVASKVWPVVPVLLVETCSHLFTHPGSRFCRCCARH